MQLAPWTKVSSSIPSPVFSFSARILSRLRAHVHRHLRHLAPEHGDRPGIRDDGRVRAEAARFPRGLRKGVQFVVEGIAVHRHVELLPGPVAQPGRFLQLLRAEVPREGPQAEALHSPVDGVRAEVDRGAQGVHVAGGRQQFRHAHHRIPLSSSYFFHRFE